MKTENYNPSVFEVNLAKAILACKDEIQKKLEGDLTIIEAAEQFQLDNPMITLHLQDKDGDQHEVVVKVIQRPDKH